MRTAQERNLLARADELGLVVKFDHRRKFTPAVQPAKLDQGYTPPRAAAKGGTTICRIYFPDDKDFESPAGIGVAKCADHDTYNKGIGRAIALGRAFKQFDALSNLA